MSKYLALFSFGVLCFANATPALACGAPSENSPGYTEVVVSLVHAKDVPKGTIQLKVEALDFEDIDTIVAQVGLIDLKVKQVLNGEFSDSTILLNSTNVDNCNSRFGPHGEDFFITVLPMEYADGQPVLNKNGKQEFGSLFYKSEALYEFENRKLPQFAENSPNMEWNLSFHDPVKLDCLYRGSDNPDNLSADTWRQCVKPGEYLALDCERKKEGKLVCKENENALANRPPELLRGYSFWVHHQTTIASILLAFGLLVGLGYFIRSRKLRTS